MAALVYRGLQKEDRPYRRKLESQSLPDIEILTMLLNVLFFASIKSEEGRSIQIQVFYTDPKRPDPHQPPIVRMNRWRIYPFAKRIPLTVAHVVKFAKAADPWSSGVAVFHTESEGLFIWGLIDQVNAISLAMFREGDSTYPPPGLFHMLISGPADISVFRDFSFVARLAQDLLIDSQNDCLWTGEVSAAIDQWIEPMLTDVAGAVGRRALAYRRGQFRYHGKQIWTGTLSRVLLSIQRQRHGGALLITPFGKDDLSIKYDLCYSRIDEAQRALLYELTRLYQMNSLQDWRRVSGDKNLSWRSYKQELVAKTNIKDAEDTVSGAVRFISSMAGVDGLVLANPTLDILGFGAEITTKVEVPTVLVTKSPFLKDAIPIQSNNYGTRHRSMFRYVASHVGSLGFVVSQDGDVRAMMANDGKVYIFDNPKLHAFWDDDIVRMMKSLNTKKNKTSLRVSGK